MNTSEQDVWRLQAIIEGARVATWEWNVQTGETVFNDRWAEIIGYTLDDLAPVSIKTWETHAHPDDLKRSHELLERHFRGESPFYDLECRMRHRDGRWVWVHDRGKVITWTPDGKPLLMFGTYTDISARKRAEEASASLNRQMNSVLSSISDAFFSLDHDMVVTYFNDAAEVALGKPRNEVLGRKLFDAFPQARGSIFEEQYTKALRERLTLSFETYFGVEPYVNWYEVRVYPFEDGISVYFQLITERKRAEESLRFAHEKLEAFWDVATLRDADPHTICDHTLGSIVRISRSLFGFFGFINEDETVMTIHAWSGEAMKGCTMLEKPSQFSIREAGIWGEAIRQRRVFVMNHYAAPHAAKKGLPAGHVPLSRLLVVPVFSHGRIIAVAAVANKSAEYTEDDAQQIKALVENIWAIIDRKIAEGAVAAEKERLAVTLRSIGDGVITTDTSGCIVLMNRVAEVLCGWQQDEARGKPIDSVFKIISEESRQPRESPVNRVLATGEVVELADHTLLVSRDGVERIVADSGAPIRDNDGTIIGVVLVFRDMTEKQRLMEHVQNVQKLESLGVLAGGIAHDFNNLMGGVFGYIELAREEPDSKRAPEFLLKAMSSIDRARALTGQLLTFAKGGAPVRALGNLFPFVQETARFALSGANVSCRFQVPPDLWACDFDRNQIGQVVDNIVINAQQAMPLGGSIELSARNITLAAKEHPILAEGDYVRISVRDSGIGIPREMLSRIFDPYFTTKAKGHGLGLATCYSIVRRHGGAIDVDSELGKGSTFHVYLPASPGATQTPSPQEGVRHSGRGTILVMDDEEIIRETMRKMLERFGYGVVCLENGRDAVEFFTAETKAGRRFAALIFDLTVPGGMGGKEAARQIRAADAALPIFVASGYADDPVMKNPTAFGFTASICKPFRKSDLAEILNRYGRPVPVSS